MKHTFRLLLTALAISGVTFAAAGTPPHAQAAPQTASPSAVHAQ